MPVGRSVFHVQCPESIKGTHEHTLKFYTGPAGVTLADLTSCRYHPRQASTAPSPAPGCCIKHRPLPCPAYLPSRPLVGRVHLPVYRPRVHVDHAPRLVYRNIAPLDGMMILPPKQLYKKRSNSAHRAAYAMSIQSTTRTLRLVWAYRHVRQEDSELGLHQLWDMDTIQLPHLHLVRSLVREPGDRALDLLLLSPLAESPWHLLQLRPHPMDADRSLGRLVRITGHPLLARG